jgi:hypothetical protein
MKATTIHPDESGANSAGIVAGKMSRPYLQDKNVIPGKRSCSGKTSNKGFLLNYSLTNQVNFDILMLHFYYSRYFILCAGCRPAAL